MSESRAPEARAGRFAGFHDLMRHRVHDLLLVSSLYDAFILAEDGQLGERILGQFLDYDLLHTPGLARAATGAQALARVLEEPRIDLVISSPQVGDMDARVLARQIRNVRSDVRIVVLGYDLQELRGLDDPVASPELDGVFLWQGDAAVLFAIVMAIEDRMNVANDTGVEGVQMILVVEDSIRYYSSFLPVVYAEVLGQSRRLVPDGLNPSHTLMRLRARPKILLARTWEEAWHWFSCYEENVLGVICDLEFPRDGRLLADAGTQLVEAVRARRSDVPCLLQSTSDAGEAARRAGAVFLQKGSPFFLSRLRRFMAENFGFGDFIFRDPDGREALRATDLRSMEAALTVVAGESLAYHGARNHFSRWLKARTEFALAHRLRPRRVEDFPSIEHFRDELVRSVREYRHARARTLVAEFRRDRMDEGSPLWRIGGGSLGGKARGLAFANLLLDEYALRDRFRGVRVAVPQALVIGTEVFEEVLDAGGLRDFALTAGSDDELRARFDAAELPAALERDLAAFLDRVREPVAVRSSSLLEDSPLRPFAGVYETVMLPNTDPDPRERLWQLLSAIRRVYASTFMQRARVHLEATPYRLEEEKMAVLIQRLVGRSRGDRFYPDFAGVARSHNFYPMAPMTSADGMAAVALGMGTAVVQGEVCVRFCPRYPRHTLHPASLDEVTRSTQHSFHAIDLSAPIDWQARFPGLPRRYDIGTALEDGTLAAVGSTYSPDNDAVYDGISRPGVPFVSFAPILKHGVFPLADVLDTLLGIGREGTGAEVEIEFAVRLGSRGEVHEFGFLQLRPLAERRAVEEVDLGDVAQGAALCTSGRVLGHGRLDRIRDVVVAGFRHLDRARSRDLARAVRRMNAALVEERRPYVLVAAGRWGSTDPALGIPVTWEDISGARVIVEAVSGGAAATPSQGSHFFQNLVAASVGYFTVDEQDEGACLDWDWLDGTPARSEDGALRHLRFDDPLLVLMDGKGGRGAILKPDAY